MPFHDLFLWSHILFGSLALAAGTLAMIVEKGRSLHRKAGRIFAAAMTAVLTTAVALSLLDPNPFLFAVALFSGYLLFTGWRAAGQRSAGTARLDSFAATAMLLLGAGMAAVGLVASVTGDADDRTRILAVFGAIGLGFASVDLWTSARGGVEGARRIARHIGRMGGAYIATITAVAAVNLEMLPELLRWLGPTAAISPLLAWFSERTLRRRSP